MASGSFVKIPDIKFTKLFINGNFVDSISGKTFGTIDPRTGEQIARIAEGDKEDVNLAVKAARVAFDHGPWPRLSGSAIRRIMMKYADLINENTEELVALDTIDAGKLFGRGKAVDIPAAAETLRYYAGAADKIHGETLKMSQELQADTLHEPVGVVGHIIPWNFPSIMFSTKVAPALAARCTMIVKPAEQTPLSALHNAHLAKLVPDGLANHMHESSDSIESEGASLSTSCSLRTSSSSQANRALLKSKFQSYKFYRVHRSGKDCNGSSSKKQLERSVAGAGREVPRHNFKKC